MSTDSVRAAPTPVRVLLAVHTGVFAVCSFYALTGVAGGMFAMFDPTACVRGFCTELADNWVPVLAGSLVGLLILAIGVVLHVEGVVATRQPGHEMKAIYYGVASLVIPMALLILTSIGVI